MVINKKIATFTLVAAFSATTHLAAMAPRQMAMPAGRGVRLAADARHNPPLALAPLTAALLAKSCLAAIGADIITECGVACCCTREQHLTFAPPLRLPAGFDPDSGTARLHLLKGDIAIQSDDGEEIVQHCCSIGYTNPLPYGKDRRNPGKICGIGYDRALKPGRCTTYRCICGSYDVEEPEEFKAE